MEHNVRIENKTDNTMMVRQWFETNTSNAFFNTKSFKNGNDLLNHLFDVPHIKTKALAKINKNSSHEYTMDDIQIQMTLFRSENGELREMDPEKDPLVSSDNAYVAKLVITVPDYKNGATNTTTYVTSDVAKVVTETDELPSSSIVEEAKMLSIKANLLLEQMMVKYQMN